MNFLQHLKGITKKSIAVVIFVTCFSVVSFSQVVTSPQDQGRRYGEPGFRGEPINLRVVNADIRDILNYITEQYGVNFVIDKSVAKLPITVNLSDVPWNVALESILRSQDLRVQNNGGILRIVDKKALDQEVEEASKSRTVQIDNSPLYTEFIRLNYARAAGRISESNFTSGTSSSPSDVGNSFGGVSGTLPSGSASNANEGILPIIKRRLSSRGSVEVENRSNTIIITDVRENIDAIRQLVILLDQPEPQVEIEARIVIANRNFSRDVGFQLSGLVLGRNGAGVNLGTLPRAGTITPPKIDSNAGILNGQPNGALTSQPNNNLASAIGNTIIGLTTGVFGTARIDALLTAGEQSGQAKTIATPRVTALNNREATIEDTQQIPIQTIQSGLGTSTITTQYRDVPLKLVVTPQITDAGTVLLSVVVENSAVNAQTVNPIIRTQRMKNEVMVPDGGTTVVGGALIDVEGEDVFRTPGVSRIPVIGNLFKRKAVSRQTQEILFFITPRIYRPDYNGNPTSGAVSNSTRTTTIIQPVPLGNPPSNSQDPGTTSPPATTVQQPVTIPVTTPVVPVTAPTPRP